MLVARRASVVVVAAAALAVAAAASMAFGAVHVPLADIWDALTGQAAEGPLRQIVLELRLPRTVVGGRRRRGARRRRRAAAGRARATRSPRRT